MLINMKTGTINLVNPGLISHNDILETYKKHVNKDITWNNITIDEQNSILKSKRSNNMLSTEKLEKMYKVKNIRDVIDEILI